MKFNLNFSFYYLFLFLGEITRFSVGFTFEIFFVIPKVFSLRFPFIFNEANVLILLVITSTNSINNKLKK